MKIRNLPIKKISPAGWLFALGSLLLLIFLLWSSSEAGISGDEELHYNQSVQVYNYFASWGKDQSALNTPTTHLKFYGQSFDNLTTILIRWFNISDIYTFRHLANAIAAWLTILLAAWLAIGLTGSFVAGILTLILFALSPTFLGHAQNNLKDIPFALAYLAGIIAILKWYLAPKKRWYHILALIISIGFCISIRPGGLLLICYLFMMEGIAEIVAIRNNSGIPDIRVTGKRIAVTVGIAMGACLTGILLWPYALQHPISGLWESYQVMAAFPTTIRQIFEGNYTWSDWLPWYYLPKTMLITIPLLIWIGLLLFVEFGWRLLKSRTTEYAFLIFCILFPILFVILEKSNLYGSWRHFLFVYPLLITLAAVGFSELFKRQTPWLRKALLVVAFGALAWHPISFMAGNHPYYYLYYNQLVGGLKGAYARYETDYYYNTIGEGSEWLIDYLKTKEPGKKVKIGTNFPANWFFRNETNLEVSYIPFSKRSQHDWDYYISANSYIHPALLRNHNWPSPNSIKTITVDEVPVCTVEERKSRSDLEGYRAAQENRFDDAAKYFEDAIQKCCKDEVIFYNFASVLWQKGEKEKAINMLGKGLEINPENETILLFLANIYNGFGELENAVTYYQKAISANKKYFDAYPPLAKIWIGQQKYRQARELLKGCLVMKPDFKPAIEALADSYRTTNPDIAAKYDELAKK